MRHLTCLTLCLLATQAYADTTSPLAHYAFTEGAGAILHDTSGHGHDGTLHGPAWIEQAGRPALCFANGDQYIDLGNAPTLKPTGDSTILAWLYLDANVYPDGATNWTIVDCEAYRKEGFILRVDGGAAKTMYRICQAGTEQYKFGNIPIENRHAYCIGAVRDGNTATIYVDGRPDVTFPIIPPASGDTPLRIGAAAQSFQGVIFDVTLYDKALSSDEIAALFWKDAARYGKDNAQQGKIFLKPHVYYDEKRLLAETDFFGVLPLAEGETLFAEIAPPNGNALVMREANGTEARGRIEFDLPLESLPPGDYELRTGVRGATRTIAATAPFPYPAPSAEVPSPESLEIGPIPATPPPPDLAVEATTDGGFTIHTGNRDIAVASGFSYPNGGANHLGDATATDGEPEWKITANTALIEATGKYYAVSRRLKTESGRVVVSDTLTNLTSEPIGVIFHNTAEIHGAAVAQAYVAGRPCGVISERSIKTNPTMFLRYPGMGLGLIPLDDVYIVQSQGAFDGQKATLASNEFALDAHASHTLEWAVYVNATGDYYDFVNAVRHDEGRNNVTIEGTLAFVPDTQRHRDASLVPDADFFDIRGVKYATLYCISWCTDDPQISVEGIEYTNYPQEKARIKAMMDGMRNVRPEVQGMFHIAHQLYATDTPDTLWPNARVLDANGKQTVYPHNYEDGSYFSKERYQENWRWWIFYPTLDNGFGQAMLDSVDVMMDELGCRGAFMDGFLWAYGGDYTYDRWDGHTADIAPDTKTIVRKKASSILMQQDALIAYCQKIWAKGGTVIANNIIPTRTMCAQPLIVDREVTEGPELHLAPTCATLGNPGAITCEADVYRDVLAKLAWGNLYFYYGEPAKLTYESVPKRMYPFTVEEIHSGYVKGKERLITLHSGVYGWPNSRALHTAYRYDSRGHRIRPNFVTRVDNDSVRTKIDLEPFETAILEKIPVQIVTSAPINAAVTGDDNGHYEITLSGKAHVVLTPETGTTRMIEVDGTQRIQI